MKLHVYCLTERINELPQWHGIGGAPVRRLELGNFSIWVSDFAGEAMPVNRENALTHAAVVQNILNHTTPLPFRFATLVTEPQIESYVIARQAALEAKLELVRGCVEMSVKIIGAGESTQQATTNNDRQKPGTAFLSEKRREILGGQARAAEAKRVAEWLEGHIRDVVREIQINTNPTEKLILALAHLVRREAVEQYRARLTEARHDRPELHFLISGPWAPYSFANIDLEFKTHFGVS
jgi:hypothetical protein